MQILALPSNGTRPQPNARLWPRHLPQLEWRPARVRFVGNREDAEGSARLHPNGALDVLDDGRLHRLSAQIAETEAWLAQEIAKGEGAWLMEIQERQRHLSQWKRRLEHAETVASETFFPHAIAGIEWLVDLGDDEGELFDDPFADEGPEQ